MGICSFRLRTQEGEGKELLRRWQVRVSSQGPVAHLLVALRGGGVYSWEKGEEVWRLCGSREDGVNGLCPFLGEVELTGAHYVESHLSAVEEICGISDHGVDIPSCQCWVGPDGQGSQASSWQPNV